MKKTVGNIEVELHQADSQGEAFTMYLSVKTSTVPRLNLTTADARDLQYALTWALNENTPVTDRSEQSYSWVYIPKKTT